MKIRKMICKMDMNLKTQLRISAVAYIGQIIVGFVVGWTAPVIPKLEEPAQTPLPNVLAHGQGSWIGSVAYIGTIIGPYVTSYMSNKYGRRPCFFLSATVFVLAFIILAFAQNLAMIYIGRILQGISCGIISVNNLVYIGEIASTNIRGILLTGIGIFWNLGILIVYAVGPYVSYSMINFIGCAISAVYLIGISYIPESPLYFQLKGQEDKAKHTLSYLGRHDNPTVSNKNVEPNTTGWKDLFTTKNNRKALALTLTLNILQQLSGAIVLIFFATNIFGMVGSSINPDVATIFIGLTEFLTSMAAPIFVERSGRKVLMLVSTAFCSLSLAVCGVFMYLNEFHIEAAQKVLWLPLVTLITFFLFYNLGLGIIPGTLIGEMFQSNVRSTGSTLTVTVACIFGFLVSSVFEYMIVGLGAYTTFWFYSGVCAMTFFFTLFCVPETKGKTFEDIQDILNGKSFKC